jgi:hypothetical protein
MNAARLAPDFSIANNVWDDEDARAFLSTVVLSRGSAATIHEAMTELDA